MRRISRALGDPAPLRLFGCVPLHAVSGTWGQTCQVHAGNTGSGSSHSPTASPQTARAFMKHLRKTNTEYTGGAAARKAEEVEAEMKARGHQPGIRGSSKLMALPQSQRLLVNGTNASQLPEVAVRTTAELREATEAHKAKERGQRYQKKLEECLIPIRKYYHQCKQARAKGDLLTENQLTERYQTAVIPLDLRLLTAASLKELLELLRITSFFQVHSSQIVGNISRILVSRTKELDAAGLQKGIEAVVHPQTMLGLKHRTNVSSILLTELLSNEKCFASLSIRNLIHLMVLTFNRNENIIPAYLGAHLVVKTLQRVGSDEAFRKKVRATHVAIVAQGITHFNIVTPEAKQFFLSTSEVVAEQALELSPTALSYLLLCYATVKYPSAELFMQLGHIAGDMGELLHPDEAARILSAFSATTINCDGLRASLESSMRMKYLNRKPLHREES